MNYNKFLKDDKDTNLKNLIVPKDLLNDHNNRVEYENQEQAIKEEGKEGKEGKEHEVKENKKKQKKHYKLTKPRPPIVYKKYPKLNDLIRY